MLERVGFGVLFALLLVTLVAMPVLIANGML
jgi:hypothetical protein